MTDLTRTFPETVARLCHEDRPGSVRHGPRAIRRLNDEVRDQRQVARLSGRSFLQLSSTTTTRTALMFLSSQKAMIVASLPL